MRLPMLAGLILKPAAVVLDALATPGRRSWSSGERTHLEVRGFHEPGREDAARDLEQRLAAVEGVHGAAVNAALGRVVVGHEPHVTAGALARVIGEVERDWALTGRAPRGEAHPANPAPAARELVALGTAVIGLSFSALGRVLPVRALPPVVPALAALVDSTPGLRGGIERLLGRPAADAVFAIGGTASQALAQRPIALVTDAAYRWCMRGELIARRQAWERWERHTGDRMEFHRAPAVERPARPRPPPAGPVERVAHTSAGLGVAGAAGVLLARRDGGRATGLLIAAAARPAKASRDAFAARLARDLAAAGSLVLEPDSLRRLDRVDQVVLSTDLLRTGRRVIGEVAVTDESTDLDEATSVVYDLADPDGPPRSRGDWTVRQRGDELEVRHRGTRVAVATLEEERHPLADAVLDAAKRAGAVVETPPDEVAARVRELQADGHLVAVVSADPAALAGADVGIGVPAVDERLPWQAHVLCPGPREVCGVLDAVEPAHRASRYGAGLSIAGSTFGALFGGFGPSATAAGRASFPVHFATLLALAVGTWTGSEAGRRPLPIPTDRTPWHAMSPEAVLSRLNSRRAGLAAEESEERRRAEAAAGEPEVMGLARASAEELAGPLTPALAAGAGVSASLGSLTDAALIIGVLGLNALIGGLQRLGADRELHHLIDSSALQVRLRRVGTALTARADVLVPGDVIELRAGDAVPADCRVLDALGLEVDESSLTGESQPVTKSPPPTTKAGVADRTSMLYRGTAIAAGRGSAVVVATGERTEAGRTARLDGDAPPVTGVAARLAGLTRITLPVTVGSGAALLLADLARGNGISQALGRAVGLSVAAVPEGLPFVATVAELASARRLASRGVLVRSPSTIEALGRVDLLCFDKTGTLTEGRIRVRLVSDGSITRDVGELTPAMAEILAAAVRASPWHESAESLPDATDRAVLDAAQAHGAGTGGLGEPTWLGELPFEPSRGYHATLTATPDGPLLSVKGAPEAVLARCDPPVSLDAVDRLAHQGFRVLAVAERRAGGLDDLDDDRVRGLTFRGLLALADPVRPTAAQAVADLRRAGVRVAMITGDHPSTAAAIAAELSLGDGTAIMTGAEVETSDDDELAARAPEITVFARVSPAQKARIVRQLNRAGRVVAMTGDGANDVPAIRLAHVGVALGATATPAAREAADLVVADDRIETIIHAIVEGRAMWVSVRDALSILLGGNLGEVGFTVGAGLVSTRDTLNARQLLLVNLLTDVLPAMAVAVRPPPGTSPGDLLSEGPEASLGAVLTHDLIARAVTTATAALAGWLAARPVATPRQASTTGLVALVAAQLGQTVAVRGRTPLVVAAGAGSLLALAVVVQIPGLSGFFGCSPLLPHQWALALTAATAAAVTQLVLQRLRA
ncbi:cation-translocating P-type ATPase [Amycolatopsis tucumanensis]|uniref:Cation-transporting ATPase I n=1 Tax=Amycolatopsis tucumanensis TaxID=401106 RepID=A0ABP7HEA0_9PSEU|nr:cation-translocating P-type ATPase [Amycolatopsis tucumanensis]MCF6421407.1 cation-translocating P-type ATPase [Amycolatopsis tucumanensis]